MARITRTRLLVGAAALALVAGVTFQGTHQGQAATFVGVTPLTHDLTITTSATGVTLTGTTFADGTSTAKCFAALQNPTPGVFDASPAATNQFAPPMVTYYGDCTGDTIASVDSSGVNDSTAAKAAGLDELGAAATIDTNPFWTYYYDAGDAAPFSATAVGSFIHPTLEVNVTNNAGENVVIWWNNDTSAARSGCVNYVDAGGESAPQCVAESSAAGPNGFLYEAQTAAGSGTFAETKCLAADYAACTGSVGADGNMPTAGVFFLSAAATGPTNTPAATDTPAPTETPGGPTDTPTTVVATATATTPVLAASYVRVNRAHGLTKIHWLSTEKVRGFNVFDKHMKINKHLVTSKTAKYHFTTHHVFKQLRLKPVQ